MRVFSLRTVPALLAAMTFATACSDKSADQHLAAAKAFISKGSDRAATIELKNALSVNPKLAEARFLLGVLTLKDGKAETAEMELREAKDAGYDDEEVDPELADALLAGGKAPQLVEQFHGSSYQDATTTARMQTDLASAYRQLDQADRARRADDAALRAVPDFAPALMERVRQDAAKRDFAAATDGIEKLLAKNPHDPDAWKLKGDVLLASNRDAAPALEAYRHAVQEKPNHVPANVAVLMSLMQMGQLDAASAQLESLKKVAPPSAQTDYLAAQLAFQKKDFDGARVLTQKMLQHTPDSPLVLQLAGAIELQAGAFAQAESDLNKALHLAPHLALARRLLVTTYLRSGRPSEAAAALDAQVQKDGIDPGMFELAGEAYLRVGDAAKANTYFTRALELAPADSATRTGLALTHMLNGSTESAFDELQTIGRDDKSGDMADLALISARLSKHDYAAAISAANALQKKQPSAPLPVELRARAQLGMGDKAAARKSFEQALALDPTFVPAAMNLAVLDERDHKPEEAKKRLGAILEKNPKNAEVLLALAQISAGPGGDPVEGMKLLRRAVDASPENVEARLTLIEACLGQKDYRTALDIAQAGVSTLPKNPQLLEALGRVQQISGAHDQAVNTFGKLIALAPNQPGPHVRQAEAYAADKDFASAEKSLRAALEMQPDLLDAQGALVILAIEQRHYDDAVKVAQTVQKQRPKNSPGFILEGLVKVEQKKWDEAAAVYRRGLDQTGSTDLAIKLHEALQAAGGPDADRFAGDWTRQHPKDVQFLEHLGDSAISKKDFEGAGKQYQAALRVQPDNPGLLNNMAWIEGQLHRDDAVDFAQKANSITPNQPDSMDTLAMLLGDRNQLPQAIALESKAVALRPGDPKLRLDLAKLYIKSRDNAHAKTELETLAKLGDRFAAQHEVADLLKHL